MTQADRDSLVAAAQVLLREGIGATFWDTGEDTISNGDAAEMLFDLAGWEWGYDANGRFIEYCNPQPEPHEWPAVGGAYGMTGWYREQIYAAVSPRDNARIVGITSPPTPEKFIDEWLGRAVDLLGDKLRVSVEVEIPKPVYFNAATGESQTLDQMNERWAYDQQNLTGCHR